MPLLLAAAELAADDMAVDLAHCGMGTLGTVAIQSFLRIAGDDRRGLSTTSVTASYHWRVKTACLLCLSASTLRSGHGCGLKPLNGGAWPTGVCAANCSTSATLRSVEPGADADDLCTPGPSAASIPFVHGRSACTGGHPPGAPILKALGLCGRIAAPHPGCMVKRCGPGAPGASPVLDAANVRSNESAECGRSALPTALFGSTCAQEKEPPAGVDAPLLWNCRATTTCA